MIRFTVKSHKTTTFMQKCNEEKMMSRYTKSNEVAEEFHLDTAP